MATVKTAHTTSSIRARSRAAPARPDASAPDRKVVYKPVVDNPLAVQWPPLPASVRNEILNQLLQLVQGPPLLSGLVVGINQVTRALESRIRWGRWELGDSHAAPPSTSNRLARGIDEQPQGGDGGGGRKRKRKHHANSSSWSSAAAAVSSSSVPALPLGDHPAYLFLHGARTAPSRDVLPPYFCLDQSSESLETSSSPRILVNSDARRLTTRTGAETGDNDDKKKKKTQRKKTKHSAGTTLLPAHPGVASSKTANADDVGANSAAISEDEAGSSSPPPPPPPPPTVPLVDLVFVCKPDINPPSLVAHLPTMVAAANGVQTALDSVLQSEHEHGAGPVGADAEAAERMQLDAAGPEEREKEGGGPKRPEMRPVLLIPLDLGAERKLADALGLRRVAAIAVSSLLPAASALHSLLQSHKLQPLSTPWLVPYLLHPHAPSRQRESSLSRFAPTTIKHVKTSAPLNPKAGVQQRKEARKEKKDAIVEMKRKKRKLAIEKARGVGTSSHRDDDDVYVAED